MIRLDSICIIYKTWDVVNNFCKNYFKENSEKLYGRIVVNNKYILLSSQSSLGLNGIILNPEKEFVKLEISSKILGDKACNLININNIEEVFENINNLGIVDFDIQTAIDLAIVQKCDVTNDLRPEKEVQKILSAILAYKINPNYYVESYNKKKILESVIFRNKARSFYERIIFYDKYLESGDNNFKGILRVERNFKGKKCYDCMREAFKIDKEKCRLSVKGEKGKQVYHLDLLSILNSKANPNLDLVEKISLKGVPKIFTLPDTNTLSQLYKYHGKQKIIESCGHDFGIVKDLLKKHSKGNTTAGLRELQKISLNMQQSGSQIEIPLEIEELKRLLAND